ncbi:hypothetical protein SLEP1_g8016 [Rubroshorea leprosula]|uniref:Uncharacterized protein n=1 Tax=Rubroshorea leprosula TaxID=152421 RepID=A0AAV5I082_9ROSI|nr:hypothetical protein SLEP1_g8016 [Rubroshorea leprosula]
MSSSSPILLAESIRSSDDLPNEVGFRSVWSSSFFDPRLLL